MSLLSRTNCEMESDVLSEQIPLQQDVPRTSNSRTYQSHYEYHSDDRTETMPEESKL